MRQAQASSSCESCAPCSRHCAENGRHREAHVNHWSCNSRRIEQCVCSWRRCQLTSLASLEPPPPSFSVCVADLLRLAIRPARVHVRQPSEHLVHARIDVSHLCSRERALAALEPHCSRMACRRWRGLPRLPHAYSSVPVRFGCSCQRAARERPCPCFAFSLC